MSAKDTALPWEKTVAGCIRDGLSQAFGLVSDADHILSGAILQALVNEGLQVISVSEPLLLRFEYETRLRQGHFASETPSGTLLFVLDFSPARLPYDILQAGSLIVLSMEQFFPRLSARVLRELPSIWLPVIYQNQDTILPFAHLLDDAGTARLALQLCLGLDAEIVNDLTSLLGLLTEVAGREVTIPRVVQPYLVSGLAWGYVQRNNLNRLLEIPQEARTFLQHIWQTYLHSRLYAQTRQVIETDVGEEMQMLGVLAGHRENQDQFTRLLLDNVLQPARAASDAQPPDWMRLGVHYYVDQVDGLRTGLKCVVENLPDENSSLENWLGFAHQWAGWRIDRFYQAELPIDILEAERGLEQQIHARFPDWLLARYASLLQQPYLPYPATVAHVARYLAARHTPTPENPLAVVVLDGMALEDWLVVRQTWQQSNLPWQIEEHAVLALIPTLTSVSRQSLLSGKLPRHFSASWLTTQDEHKLWRSFWEGQGLYPASIGYLRGLGVKSAGEDEPTLESEVETLLAQPNLAVTALVVNTVDDLVHGSLLGAAALHAQLRLWAARNGYLQRLISRLLERFATVVITSDHGHIEGRGIGDIPLSSVAEERALRARVFTAAAFGNLQVDEKLILRWPNLGLPDDARVFLPKGDGLFAAPTYSGISHGGASLPEVVIPLVLITR